MKEKEERTLELARDVLDFVQGQTGDSIMVLASLSLIVCTLSRVNGISKPDFLMRCSEVWDTVKEIE
jgi:hypothetical protein